jgi:type IX secretion system PorP/SprF family membrane protein
MAIITYRNIYPLVAFLIFGHINLFSQETSIYQNYYLNPFIINPAATGAEYYPLADLSVRRQWLGFPDAPSTLQLSVNFRTGRYDFYDPKKFLNKGPLKLTDRIGLGASIFRDKNGPLALTGGILSYAYHVPINSDLKLAFGLSSIFNYFTFNSSILKPDQNNDPYLLYDNDNVFRVNFNIGIYFYNDIYFIGCSANKIIPDIKNINDKIKEQPSLFLMSGYKFFRNNNSFILEPSIIFKKIANYDISVDIHAKLYILKSHWIAISYSTDNKINFRFGLLLYKRIYAGYNYEYMIGDIASYNFGSHEIHLGINLGLIGIKGIRETW